MEFLGETVQMLLIDGRKLMAEIRRAADSADAAAVGRAAHTLKGMISNFCSPGTHTHALAVERMGREQDLTAAPPALDALETSLDALIEDLNDFLNTTRA